jgi:hypothetical protein
MSLFVRDVSGLPYHAEGDAARRHDPVTRHRGTFARSIARVRENDVLDVGPRGDSLDELITLLELQQALLASVATGGPRIETVDWV